MKKAALPETVVKAFIHYFEQVQQGASGMIPESDITLPQSDNLIFYSTLEQPQDYKPSRVAIIKLNGGLGTSMGLKKAKSLLKVKDNYNFLDIICKQTIKLREKTGLQIPLLFMNSFNTRYDTLEWLKRYPELKIPGIPLDFIQNRFPKIRRDNLAPLQLAEENLNWNPPGHGEIYLALEITGTLQKLAAHHIDYIFISNSDNLGAIINSKILHYLQDKRVPFLMEVCLRTEMDKKGGHLAQGSDGQLLLREVAQCPQEDIAEFQNVDKYRYFNTNNLWVNLLALKKKLAEYNNILPLPLILNTKEVNGCPVYQLETAMGAAIGLFPGAKAIVVDRHRFVPVKKTDDLLALWSDAYKLSEGFNIIIDSLRGKPPVIRLDEHYREISQLEEHFRDGIPSLRECTELNVAGDVYFGPNVKIRGKTAINATKKTYLKNKILTGMIEI
ncbi:MAG: UTP--glucose-1-phosphate uridylyltransferase [Candidatus Cloacimonetes bacterium]|nr:UTP--glucose-1-phosphate uridylyltransferase [Candidatus Cloacimonadota bacterium]